MGDKITQTACKYIYFPLLLMYNESSGLLFYGGNTMDKIYDKNLSPKERAEAVADILTVEEQAAQLRFDAPPIEKLNLPAYNWWNEALHGLARAGTATMFPQAIGMAACFDTELIKKSGEAVALEARAKYNAIYKNGDHDIYKGLTMWAPNINIFRDPRWGRGHETYGEDPYLTAELGKAYVKGLQGNDEYLAVAACAKHFAVHSGPEAIRHTFDAKATPKDLEETYLPAFKALVCEAEVEGVMGAYNRVNGEPACASEFLMKKLQEWNFDGYFVSDCWAIRDFHENHKVTSCPEESVTMALKSGCHINCGCTYQHIMSAYSKGMITVDDIRKCFVRAMTTRIRLGQLDKTPFDSIPYSVVACNEHIALSQKIAEKSAVLLENNGILPLDKKSIKTLAVIGPNADSRNALTGNYCGTAQGYVTYLEGISERFDGRIYYSEGCCLFKDRSETLAQSGDRYAEAVAVAKESDAVILCLGLDATLEGEEGDTGNSYASGDKPDLRLPESQRILLRKIKETGKPLIVVLSVGSSINIESKCDALINMWYPGQYGGKALARLLFGDISPSGKLPVTFYKDSSLLPDFEDYSMKNRTYRYCDDDNVLYPFGYGLTYDSVKIKLSDISFSQNAVSVTAENIGTEKGENVIEIYARKNEGENLPKHSLCGFMRIELEAGEKKRYEIKLSKSSFDVVNEKGERRLQSGSHTLFVDFSQPDENSIRLDVEI